MTIKSMRQNAKQFVKTYLGEELWTEVKIRIKDGQKKGQAFMNAGSHADAKYSYLLSDWVLEMDDWMSIAVILGHYKTPRFFQIRIGDVYRTVDSRRFLKRYDIVKARYHWTEEEDA